MAQKSKFQIRTEKKMEELEQDAALLTAEGEAKLVRAGRNLDQIQLLKDLIDAEDVPDLPEPDDHA